MIIAVSVNHQRPVPLLTRFQHIPQSHPLPALGQAVARFSGGHGLPARIRPGIPESDVDDGRAGCYFPAFPFASRRGSRLPHSLPVLGNMGSRPLVRLVRVGIFLPQLRSEACPLVQKQAVGFQGNFMGSHNQFPSSGKSYADFRMIAGGKIRIMFRSRNMGTGYGFLLPGE